MAEYNKAQLTEMIVGKLLRNFGRTVDEATPNHMFKACAMVLRDIMSGHQIETSNHVWEAQGRQVHYLSLEFLMGRSLEKNAYNLGLLDTLTQVLEDLGLGYLTLGEDTPSLSGGEAQRLKLASEMGRGQEDTVFVFDEPTIGLHPLDVRTLLGVFQTLLDSGATVVVIEHDLDVIRSADYLVDMGPGGGESGGEIVAAGTPAQVKQNPRSITGRYL